jgi:hypothetical protein
MASLLIKLLEDTASAVPWIQIFLKLQTHDFLEAFLHWPNQLQEFLTVESGKWHVHDDTKRGTVANCGNVTASD